jgi:hypothetical protein
LLQAQPSARTAQKTQFFCCFHFIYRATGNNNLILYYLRAESTATRPITDSAQCRYRQLHHGHAQYKAKDKLQEITGGKHTKQTNKDEV